MGVKGDITRSNIIEESRKLFVKKGFKDVTMSDICEATGLSRGGLYRHFSSPEEIFNEIMIEEFSFEEGIARGESAKRMLTEAFSKMSAQINNPSQSLSTALYEYAAAGHEDFYTAVDDNARKNWSDLIEYGIRSHEFKKVNIESMVDLILYYSRGLMLWSKIIDPGEDAAANYINTISDILCK